MALTDGYSGAVAERAGAFSGNPPAAVGIVSVIWADEQAASKPAARPSASIGAKLIFRKGRNLDIMGTLYQMQQRFDGRAYGAIVAG